MEPTAVASGTGPSGPAPQLTGKAIWLRRQRVLVLKLQLVEAASRCRNERQIEALQWRTSGTLKFAVAVQKWLKIGRG